MFLSCLVNLLNTFTVLIATIRTLINYLFHYEFFKCELTDYLFVMFLVCKSYSTMELIKHLILQFGWPRQFTKNFLLNHKSSNHTNHIQIQKNSKSSKVLQYHPLGNFPVCCCPYQPYTLTRFQNQIYSDQE